MPRWLTGALVAITLLLHGCATGPQRYVNACTAQTTDAVERVECIQARLRSDPQTPKGVQARIDFMVIAVRSLRSRVQAGEITREQAQAAMQALGRELEGPPGTRPETTSFVSKQTLDWIGLPAGASEFGRFVQPATAALGDVGGGGASNATGADSDRAPCVTSTCGPVNVRGYYRKDGTYVRPHTRSARGSGGRR